LWCCRCLLLSFGSPCFTFCVRPAAAFQLGSWTHSRGGVFYTARTLPYADVQQEERFLP
jgi:hypothetical protein